MSLIFYIWAFCNPSGTVLHLIRSSLTQVKTRVKFHHEHSWTV